MAKRDVQPPAEAGGIPPEPPVASAPETEPNLVEQTGGTMDAPVADIRAPYLPTPQQVADALLSLPSALRDEALAIVARVVADGAANPVRRRRKLTFLTQATHQPRTSPMKIADIARVCHEVNRAYCASLGDDSQPAWDDAPDWQRQSAISGVEFTLANPAACPSASHESWLAEKDRDGWKYGPVKDPTKKEHPCFVPYDQLPAEQKAKDYLFQGTVRALASMLA